MVSASVIQQPVEADVIALCDALALFEQTAAGVFDEFTAQLVAERPKLLVGKERRIGHLFPEFRMVDGRGPIGAEFLAEELGFAVMAVGEFMPPELAGGTFHPAEQMNAIGNVADGDFAFLFAGIQGLPHVAADLAVQFTDGVGGAGMFEREHRHAERLLRIVVLHAAEREDFAEGHGNLRGELGQREIHQIGREPVMAGLDRRVRGEEAFLLGERLGLGEILPGGHLLADEFQREERRVALVHVERGRFDAERPEQARAADAEEHFLHDAHGGVAAIDAGGEVAEMLGVFRQVGVEQIDGDAPDVHAPSLVIHRGHANLDRADEPFALGIKHRLQRNILRVNRIVIFRLPVVGINRLLEITFAVKQTDADETDAEVAGGFRMVAGQNAKAAGGNRQRFMKAELRRKIRHRILVQFRRVRVAPGLLVVQVIVEIAQHGADAVGEARFLEMDAQFVIRDIAEHGHGVVPKVLPAARREPLKQILRLLVPCTTKGYGRACSSPRPVRSTPHPSKVFS